MRLMRNVAMVLAMAIHLVLSLRDLPLNANKQMQCTW
jgi:hypothetical protein